MLYELSSSAKNSTPGKLSLWFFLIHVNAAFLWDTPFSWVDTEKPAFIAKQKQKYRGMFETQKSRNKTSSGDIGLNIRTLASPKVGQDHVNDKPVDFKIRQYVVKYICCLLLLSNGFSSPRKECSRDVWCLPLEFPDSTLASLRKLLGVGHSLYPCSFCYILEITKKKECTITYARRNL